MSASRAQAPVSNVQFGPTSGRPWFRHLGVSPPTRSLRVGLTTQFDSRRCHCSTIHRPLLLELDAGVADNFAPALGLAADEGTEFLRPASRRLKQHARDALAHVGGSERRDEFLVQSLYDCVGSLGRVRAILASASLRREGERAQSQ